jgi:PAS domain S-box-containing protein
VKRVEPEATIFEVAPIAIGVARGDRPVFVSANAALRAMLADVRLDGVEVESILREARESAGRVERTLALPLRAPGDATRNLRHYRVTAARPDPATRQPADTVLFFALDVTELVETLGDHQALTSLNRTILETMDEEVIGADPEGCIRYANRAALETHGLSRPDEIEPQMLEACASGKLHRLDGTRLEVRDLPLARAAREGVTAREQFVLQLPDGPEIFIYATAVPLVREGRSVGAVVVARNVTELMLLDRLKDQFCAVAAHELRTPLAIVDAGLRSLERRGEQPGEPDGCTLARIRRGVERIGRLVTDLLDMSELQLGRFVIHREPVDLRDLVRGAVAKAASPPGRIHVRARTPVVVSADHLRISQVLTNLLSNAVKFSPGGGDIEIELERREAEAVVSVRDHGVGIPTRSQPRVFERFFCAHADTPYDFGGIGLGLYLSKEFVASHGGRIWCESTEGVGSTFSFSLPC